MSRKKLRNPGPADTIRNGPAIRTDSMEDLEERLRRNEKELEKALSENVVLKEIAANIKTESAELKKVLREQMDNRIRTSEELIESRRKFQEIVEEVDDIIFETAADGRITFVSGRIKDVLGYETAEVIGRMPSEFFEQGKAYEVRKSLLQIMEKHGKLESVEVELTHKDGHSVYVETNAVPFFQKGILRGYRGVTRDITLRKNAEESLRLAINAANEPIYDWNLITGKMTWNEAYSAQFGDPPGRNINNWWISKIHPDEKNHVLSCIRKARQSDIIRSICDYRFKRRDGKYAYIRDRFHISRDQAGKAIRIVGAIMDITDQKRRESELELINVELEKHSKALDQILSASPDYIFLFDVNGTYAYVNDRAAALWGLRKEEIIGRRWRDIGLTAALTEEFHLKIHKVIDENVVVKGESVYPSSSGPRNFVYTMTPIGYEGSHPEGIMLIASDITERKRRDAHLAFLAGIQDDLAGLMSVDEIMQVVGSKIGAFLDVSYSYFAEFDDNETRGRLSYIWHSEKVSRLPDVISLPDARTSDQYRPFSKGETVIVQDTENDPRTRPEFFRAINMRSFIAAPFQYFSDWKSLLIVADYLPRQWRDDEIELVREVANRVFPRLERARNEAALRESEEKFRTLADASPTAIIVYRGRRIVYVNTATVEFFEGTKEELLSIDLADIIHPDYRKIALAWIQARMSGEQKPARYELKALTKSGGEKWLEISSILINYEGLPAGLAICVDVTERKRAEAELQKSKEQLEFKVRERTAQLTEMNKSLLAEIAERKRTETKLRSAQKNLRAMASEIVLAEERSRQHFATDLHDTVVQTLGAAKLRAQLIQEQIPGKVRSSFTELQEMLSESVTQARTIMAEMSPPVLNELGLECALEWLAEQVGTTHGIKVNFRSRNRGSDISIPRDIEVLLFQSTRELLMNVVKHAHARSATVKFNNNGRKLRIEVSDNGIGFDVRNSFEPDLQGGYGLYSIRERLRHIGGQLEISSKPGQGTRVIIMTPLEKNKVHSHGIKTLLPP